MGKPGDILTEEYIEKLYDMEEGSYGAFFHPDEEAALRTSPEAAPETSPDTRSETVSEASQKEASEVDAEGSADFFRNRGCRYFPCHSGVPEQDFNCLFCYCPLYALGERCGGNFRYLPSGVKDCTDCGFPHFRENYRAVLKRYPEIAALAAVDSGN